MFVESKVPKDLSKYKTRLGSFTVRQIICIVLCVAIDIILWSAFLIKADILVNFKIYITMFIDIPVMLFIYEPKGMTMEKYITTVLYRSFFWKRRRLYNTKNENEEYIITEKEKKERIKELPKLIEEHPELKAYR